MRRKLKDRREEAEARQESYDDLTTDQKIAKAIESPGDAKKQLAKLMKVIAKNGQRKKK
jgi:hypothetical protein